jgi:hypothetical protein
MRIGAIRRAVALAGIVLLVANPARAAGPEVRAIFPAGGQRGATVDITASGNFPKWPVQGWADRPGVALAATADQGKLQVTVAADAPPGLYWLRLHDAYGVSAPQPFVVGLQNETVEQESNNTPAKAQAVGTPVIVNGRLGVGNDADLFAVTLTKGQTLIAALEANETLGSPVDSVLQIVSPRGNVLAYNHDHRGLDPQIVFTAPADGSYLVRVFGFPSAPNSTIGFAGGEKYIYRLTLTSGAFVDYPWPLAITAGRETNVELIGWNIPDALRSISIKADAPRTDIIDARLANLVALPVEPHNTLVEVEPNELATPQAIELPCTLSGRIDKPLDVDAFAFEAKKGAPLVFQLASRSLGYPLDGVLEISDLAGKPLARVDDLGNARDPLLEFAPPADGRYRLAISDLTRQGSSRHVYRLSATGAPVDFEVATDANSYVLAVGKPTEITLSITRKGGFDAPISLSATGLPDFVTAAPVQSAPTGDSAKTVKLVFTASGSSAFSGPIHILARAEGASKLEHAATAATGTGSARTGDLWLTVVPAAP